MNEKEEIVIQEAIARVENGSASLYDIDMVESYIQNTDDAVSLLSDMLEEVKK